MAIIYKICDQIEWRAAERAGAYHGSEVDVRDGYIHFSTAEQARRTAALHFSGRTELMLIAVDADKLGPALRWEPSRGGALFPHLYRALPLSAVLWARPLPDESDGERAFPELAS